jgi:transcription elongation GreA/GreB family factor
MTQTTTRRKPAVLGLLLVAERLFDLKRNAAYDAAERGQLAPGIPVLQVGGRRYVVPVAALEHTLGIDVLEHFTDAELGLDELVEVAS